MAAPTFCGAHIRCPLPVLTRRFSVLAEARVQPLDPYSYDADRFLVAASGHFSRHTDRLDDAPVLELALRASALEGACRSSARGRHRPRAPALTRASLRGGREMATGERSAACGAGGWRAARATAILRSPKHLGAVERGFRNVATSVACSGALNPATGAGSRPQTVAMSVCQ
jgi:hypothetical protein